MLRALGVFWLVILVLVVAVVFLNRATPYQPFAVRGARIAHDSAVCPRDRVRVLIDRKFTQQFNSLDLTESWVAVPSDRPVETESGTLPPPALEPTDGFQEVSSPLLRRAPAEPGTYRVRIEATSHGSRFGHGVLRASGTYRFHTDNTLTVRSCTN